MGNKLVADVKNLLNNYLNNIELVEKIERINALRLLLHEYSPFKQEPVDCVLWIESGRIVANDYNPNKVAPPEMELLKLSITEDGFTQPIVAYPEQGAYTVVDGFHRNRVGREDPTVKQRIMGYLPVCVIRDDREQVDERMASTIRHNRARGKHGVESMSAIVVELARRNWSDSKIAVKLGMDADEVLRLKQMSGLAELFSQNEFSEAWEPDVGA